MFVHLRTWRPQSAAVDFFLQMRPVRGNYRQRPSGARCVGCSSRCDTSSKKGRAPINTPSRRHLYLPVESQARELDGKLLLALIAHERGYQPTIGYKVSLKRRLRWLPSGVYLAQTARQNKPIDFEKFSGFGHHVVVLDEEALVRQTDQMFMAKHERDAFDHVSLLLAWGEDDAALLRTSSQTSARVLATGNPRIDLLRQEFRGYHQSEIDTIQARLGEYVLVNTNFPTVNHYVPHSSGVKLATWVTNRNIIAEKSAFLNHKQALFDRFRIAIPKIAHAVAPTTLVIRPHPSEDPQPWIDAVKGLTNARVMREGGVVPWLGGARALIQNGCTSAVESAIMGTTVLSYRPVRSTALDNPLPNGLGIQCFDDESLINALERVLDGPVPLTPDQSRLLDRHVAGMTGRLSCDRILDGLDELSMQRRPVGIVGLLSCATRRVSHRRRRPRPIDKLVISDGPRMSRYVTHKFPDLTCEDLNERIDRFRKTTHRFHGLQARQLAKNLFTID